MEISNGIKSLLLSLLEDKVVVSSWGISNITISNASLKFDVNGIKYKGTIIIESLNSNDYNIRIDNNSINVNNPSDLIILLDYEIEKTDDYLYDLQKRLKL